MTRRRSADIELSMFPFLSVLCVVIGILMLFMIVIISTRVIGAEQSAELLPPPPTVQSALDESDSEGPGVPEEQYQQKNDEIQRLARQLLSQQKQCQELHQLRAQLETLIALKKDEIELGQTDPRGARTGRGIGLPEKVKVIPDAKVRVLKEPILVEVNAEGFLVHPQKTEYRVEELQQRNSPLQKFISGVDQQRRKQYLLLLIHPNGIVTYETLRKHLLENHNETVTMGRYRVTKSRIDLGYEPFSRNWQLIIEAQQAGD